MTSSRSRAGFDDRQKGIARECRAQTAEAPRQDPRTTCSGSASFVRKEGREDTGIPCVRASTLHDVVDPSGGNDLRSLACAAVRNDLSMTAGLPPARSAITGEPSSNQYRPLFTQDPQSAPPPIPSSDYSQCPGRLPPPACAPRSGRALRPPSLLYGATRSRPPFALAGGPSPPCRVTVASVIEAPPSSRSNFSSRAGTGRLRRCARAAASAPFRPFTGTTQVGVKGGKLSIVPPPLAGRGLRHRLLATSI